jgi:hypothetical protein
VPCPYVEEAILNKDVSRIPVPACERGNPVAQRALIKDVQDFLLETTESIQSGRDVEKCIKFRELLEQCVPSAKFHVYLKKTKKHPKGIMVADQDDPAAILATLFNLFDTGSPVRYKYDYFYTDSHAELVPPDNRHYKRSQPVSEGLILEVPYQTMFQGDPEINLPAEFLTVKKIVNSVTSTDDWGIERSGGIMSEKFQERGEPVLNHYKGPCERQVEKRFLLDAPYLVISVPRAHPVKDEVIETAIEIKRTFTANKKVYSLVSIVCWDGGSSGFATGGHYTCYFKCKKEWYFYDDTERGRNIRRIGEFRELANRAEAPNEEWEARHDRPNPMRNGHLYFYCPE